MEVRRVNVSPNYLQTMRIPLIAGREFTLQDMTRSQLVSVVDQTLAERYWPGQNAIDKRFQVGSKWSTVVGIARNSTHSRLNEPPEPALYLLLFQDYYHDPTIHLRVWGDPQSYASTVEKAVHGLNAELPVVDIMPLKHILQGASTLELVAGTYVGAFGLLALVLATVGIYGVIAYTTQQRTREFGIRMALGAQQGAVFRLVLSHGLRLTLMGLALGLVVSLALTRLLRSQLLGVATTDALTYAGVAALFCLEALFACCIPARRAARLNPLAALRCE